MKIGLEISATKKWDLVKFGLYPRLELLSGGDYGIVSMSDFLAQAKPIPRGYLSAASQKVSLHGVTDNYSYSKENLYPYCEPTLLLLPNDNLLLVWVDDLGNKADGERTTLVYSVYSNGSWSPVAPIHENGAYNDHPALCQYGDSVYLVWMRADAPIGSDWDDMTIFQHMELCFASYDMKNKSFSDVTVISDTENHLAEFDYAVAANGDEVTVTWIQNSENDLFMSEGTSSIYLRTFKDGAWGNIQPLLSTEQQISSLNISESSNGWSVLYSLYDWTTQIDATYQLNQGDSSAKPRNEIKDMLSLVDGHAYYLSNSEIYCDGSSIGLSGVTNFDVVSNERGTVILALVPTGFTCELFASYYDAGTKTWGEWIQMTSFNKYIRSYSAVLNEDGELLVAVNLVEVDAKKQENIYGNATMAVVEDLGYRDMVMGDAITYDDSAVIPGEELKLGFEITNNSRETLNSISLAINANGANKTQNINCAIAPGATEALTASYALPESLKKFSLTLTATPSYTANESRTDNNSVSVDIGLADLTLQASNPVSVNGNWTVNLTVANVGYDEAATSKIAVYAGNLSGEPLTNLDVKALNIGESATASYVISESYVHLEDADALNAFQFVLTSNTEERDYANNEARIVFDSLDAKWQATKEGTSSIKVTCSDTTIGGKFFFGVYNEDGKFLSVQTHDATDTTVLFEISEQNAHHAAVFWLDDNFKPLESAIRISLK